MLSKFKIEESGITYVVKNELSRLPADVNSSCFLKFLDRFRLN